MAIRKSSNSGIPFGNTAGRPTAQTGQPYFNGEIGRLELFTSNNSWENIVQEVPSVTSITGSYLQSSNSGTITIYGTNFTSGATAYAIGTNSVQIAANSTTFNSLVQLTATFTGLSSDYEPYDIKVVNPSNLFGLLQDALIVNNVLTWTTAAGSLGTFDELVSMTVSAVASDPDSTITYSLASGSSLPSGLTLNSSTGVISGILPDIATSTTYSFTINASDGVNPQVPRTFSITSQLQAPATFDSLIIAGGGGGGGGYYGGGGGAGGVRQLSSISRTSNQVLVTVGSGGNGGSFGQKGSNGQNSSLEIVNGSSYSATGGGAGAGTQGNGADGGSATAGGSGGGGSLYSSYVTGASGNVGGYTPVEGYAGGTGSGYQSNTNSNGGGAGGGGAGGAGESVVGAVNRAGYGGMGITSSITGTALKYAGGGGGAVWVGSQESGIYADYGGGRGSADNSIPGGNGVANTGGGGGAAKGDASSGGGSGGNGGSGVVIIAYPDTFRPIATIPGTLTYDQPTRAGYRVYRFTGGTGTITF